MTLPLQSHPFNAGGPVDPIWLAWLRTLEQGSTANNADLAAQISAIATALGSPDGTVANIPPLGGSQTQVFAGSGVQVNGNAQSGYQISLSAVADSGAGTFLLLTRDSFGRISGSVAGTAADVPYDNTTSGLTADDVQAAVDELSAEKLDDAPSDGTTYGRKDGAWEAVTGGGGGGGSQSALTAAIMALSPALYYKCDEAPGATSLADSSGNGMDLTITGTCTTGQCPIVPGGGSFYAQGSSISASRATRTGTAGLTVPMNYDYTQFIVMILIEGGTNPVYAFEISTSGETTATNAQTTCYLTNIGGTTFAGAAFWEHAGGVNDSCVASQVPGGIPFALTIRKNSTTKTVDFFYNHLLVRTIGYANEPTGGTSANTSIGANNSGTGAGAFLGSNFAHFNSLLTDSQIKALCVAAGVTA